MEIQEQKSFLFKFVIEDTTYSFTVTGALTEKDAKQKLRDHLLKCTNELI